MLLTDKEQIDLLDETPGPITDKIDRRIAVALKQVFERRIQPIETKVDEHDGLIEVFRRMVSVRKRDKTS